MRRASTGQVALLLFGSGLAALVYQTAWQRMLPLVFGITTAASSAVLAIFLGGLGLGGWLLGGVAERSKRPLLLYGNLELVVAGAASVSPWLIDGVRLVYLALGGSAELGLAGATIVRLVLTTIALGPIVVLMGGTLPAAVRAVESNEDEARRSLAWLYGINTAGAVAGALLGTFFLFELFGTRLSLWTAVALNFLVALVARVIGKRQPLLSSSEANNEGGPTASRDNRDADGQGSADQGTGSAPSWLIYISAAVAGATFLCMELVWFRMLSPVLGGSTFTFGLILAVALAGIGLGGALYTARGQGARPTTMALALTMALEALFLIIPFAFGDSIAILSGYARGAAN